MENKFYKSKGGLFSSQGHSGSIMKGFSLKLPSGGPGPRAAGVKDLGSLFYFGQGPLFFDLGQKIEYIPNKYF